MSEGSTPHLDEEALQAFLDGEIGPRERELVESHLAACGDCLSRLDDLRHLFRAIEAIPDLPLERDLTPAVLHALRRPRAGAARLRWVAALQLAFAAAILITAVPVVASALEVSARMESWVAAAQVVLQGSLGGWVAWRASVETALAGLWQSMTKLRPAATAVMDFWPWIVAFAVLGLMANGILLRWPRGSMRRPDSAHRGRWS